MLVSTNCSAIHGQPAGLIWCLCNKLRFYCWFVECSSRLLSAAAFVLLGGCGGALSSGGTMFLPPRCEALMSAIRCYDPSVSGDSTQCFWRLHSNSGTACQEVKTPRHQLTAWQGNKQLIEALQQQSGPDTQLLPSSAVMSTPNICKRLPGGQLPAARGFIRHLTCSRTGRCAASQDPAGNTGYRHGVHVWWMNADQVSEQPLPCNTVCFMCMCADVKLLLFRSLCKKQAGYNSYWLTMNSSM